MPMIEASYTRPANTTQYTANDAMSDSTSAPTALTFAGCAARGGGSGYILGLTAISSANQSTLPQYTLYLFDGTVAPTATNDNAEFNLADASANLLIGSFALANFAAVDETSGTNGNAEDQAEPTGGFPIAFTCGAGITDLYGLVKVENGYTPVSGEITTFRLHINRD